MQTENIRKFTLLCATLLLAVLASSFSPLPETTPVTYRIMQKSRLFLEGTSNVNSFTCNCTCVETFPRLQFEMEVREDGDKAIFDEAQLKIRTNTLDCGNRGMNRDMYNTLKAGEHPFITISLLEAKFQPGAQLASTNSWANLISRARLTVAGVTRTVSLQVKAKKMGEHTFRFLSTESIKMTDYNISPPTAMLGLIKVDNQIDINFDLLVSVEPEF